MRVFNLEDSRDGVLTYEGDVKKNLQEKRDFAVGGIEFFFKTEESNTSDLYVFIECLPSIHNTTNISSVYYKVNNPLQVLTAAICRKPVLVYIGEEHNDQISLWVHFEKEKIEFYGESDS